MTDIQILFDDAINFVLANAPSALLSVVILLLGFKIAKYANKIVLKINHKYSIGQETLVSIAAQLIRYVIIIFTIMIVFDRLNINISAFLAVIGAAGLAIGLALQGSLSNFAASIVIILLAPFRTGDYVGVAQLEGTVLDLGLFMTKVQTPDGVDLFIPNSQIISGQIKNFSSAEQRRTSINIGISYKENIDKVSQLISENLKSDQRTLKEKPVDIKVVELDSSQITLQVRAWVKNEHYWDYHFDITKKCLQLLQENNIEIPFPQLVVHKADKDKKIINET